MSISFQHYHKPKNTSQNTIPMFCPVSPSSATPISYKYSQPISPYSFEGLMNVPQSFLIPIPLWCWSINEMSVKLILGTSN